MSGSSLSTGEIVTRSNLLFRNEIDLLLHLLLYLIVKSSFRLFPSVSQIIAPFSAVR